LGWQPRAGIRVHDLSESMHDPIKRETAMEQDTLLRGMAERMFRDALLKGCDCITIRCYPRSDFFKGDGGLLDLTGDAEEASIRLRNADSVIGISMSYKGSSAPYMSLEPYLLAPLLTVFTENTEWKGKRGFPLYREGTAKVEKSCTELFLWRMISPSR